MGVLSEWKYIPDTDPLIDTQLIMGMAFGANRKGKYEEPGVSNEAIGRIIYRLWLSKKLPVIVQREVAEALIKLDLPIRPALVISEEADQSHITSYTVLQRAWKYCKSLNLQKAVIIAHPAHILRCAWVAKKIGFEVKVPDVSSVPYEPRSTQWWTRNKLSFFLWELYARIGWKLKGYL